MTLAGGEAGVEVRAAGGKGEVTLAPGVTRTPPLAATTKLSARTVQVPPSAGSAEPHYHLRRATPAWWTLPGLRVTGAGARGSRTVGWNARERLGLGAGRVTLLQARRVVPAPEINQLVRVRDPHWVVTEAGRGSVDVAVMPAYRTATGRVRDSVVRMPERSPHSLPLRSLGLSQSVVSSALRGGRTDSLAWWRL